MSVSVVISVTRSASIVPDVDARIPVARTRVTAKPPEAIAVLKGAGKVRIIDRAAMARLGMDTVRFNDFEDDPFTLGRGL